MTSIMRRLPYSKTMITLGVYDIIDTLGGDAVRNCENTVSSLIEVFGVTSEFTFRVDAMEEGCFLNIGLVRLPDSGLTEDGERRALNYLTDCLDQLIENAFALAQFRKNENRES